MSAILAKVGEGGMREDPRNEPAPLEANGPGFSRTGRAAPRLRGETAYSSSLISWDRKRETQQKGHGVTLGYLACCALLLGAANHAWD